MAGERVEKVRVRTARRRRATSTRWLSRQLNDPYVQRARQHGYRARSAYKLLEIDEKYRLLRPGRRVIDLGCAPGGWLQVAVERRCKVVGVDLLSVEPLEGATIVEGDIAEPEVVEKLRAALGGAADVLLSDLAATTTGQRAVDRLRAEALGETVLAMVPDLLDRGGAALIKLVRGAESGIVDSARRCFAKVKLVRPDATRRDSSEIYLLALGYRGAQGSGDRAPPS